MSLVLRRLCGALCAVWLLAGCAAKWAADTEVSESQVLWVQEPRTPKVKHVMSLKGFRQTGVSLGTVLFGKSADRLRQPVAAAAARDGRIAVADTGTRCVHLYRPADQGYHRLCSAGREEFVSPVAVAFDEELRLYVADSALGGVFIFDSRGGYSSSIKRAGEDALLRPTGIAYNADGKILYVIDTLANRVHAFSPKGESLFSFGGRGAEPGKFNFPTHLFWSPSGLLYVTDAMNFRVQVFDGAGGFKTAFGSHGDGSGDFAMPKGVAVDRFGIIYVVDSLFDNLQLFDERGVFLLTVGRRGGGFGEFWLPSGAFIDGGDKIYISDTFNQRVQILQVFGNPYGQE